MEQVSNQSAERSIPLALLSQNNQYRRASLASLRPIISTSYLPFFGTSLYEKGQYALKSFAVLLLLLLAGQSRVEAQTDKAFTSAIAAQNLGTRQGLASSPCVNFATLPAIGSVSSGSPNTFSGSLAGNNFTVTFGDVGLKHGCTTCSGVAGANIVDGTLPEPINSRPGGVADGAWPTTSFGTINMTYNNGGNPGTNYTTIAFTNPLKIGDYMHVIDVDNTEWLVFEFLDAAGNPLPVSGNVAASYTSPTTFSVPTITYPSSTKIQIQSSTSSTGDSNNPAVAFRMLSSAVKTIRFQQLNASNTYDFTFSQSCDCAGGPNYATSATANQIYTGSSTTYTGSTTTVTDVPDGTFAELYGLPAYSTANIIAKYSTPVPVNSTIYVTGYYYGSGYDNRFTMDFSTDGGATFTNPTTGTFTNTASSTNSEQISLLAPTGLIGINAIRIRPFSISSSTPTDIYIDAVQAGCRPLISIAGNVLNDVDGLTDNTVNGLGTNIGGVLKAILYDVTTGQVAAVATVATDGTYSFTDVALGNNYSVYVTSNTATVGQTAVPVVALPSGWVTIGEHLGTGTGTDLNPNGVLPIGVVSAAVTNANFGIEQLPTAGSGTATVANAGGTAPVTVPASTFTSVAPSSDTAPGSVTAIRITTFPSNVTSLTINGAVYTAGTFPIGGVIVPTNSSGAPTVPILVDPTNDTTPASVTFVFKAIDNAGKESTTTGTAVINFTAAGVPDLTPIIYARPGTLYNTTNITVVVDVFELLGVATSGPITVRLTKDTKVSLVWNSGATTVGGRSVQNSAWSFDGTSNANYYILTTSQVVAAGDKIAFGLTGTLTPGGTSGALTISSAILGGSGGEVIVNNNVDADKIEYFQQ